MTENPARYAFAGNREPARPVVLATRYPATSSSLPVDNLINYEVTLDCKVKTLHLIALRHLFLLSVPVEVSRTYLFISWGALEILAWRQILSL